MLKRGQPVAAGLLRRAAQALDPCALAFSMPNFFTPVTAPDGAILTPEEQRERWRASVDPRTGRSRGATLVDAAS